MVERLRALLLVVATLAASPPAAAGLIEHLYGRYGAIELYDTASQLSFRVNAKQLTQRVNACGTAYLAVATIALKTGALDPAATRIAWDRARHPPAPEWPSTWQRDRDLRQALQHGAPWYFAELTERVGLERLVREANALKLAANGPVQGAPEAWQVSALDQVEWVRRLAVGQLGLNRKAESTLWQALKREDGALGVRYGLSARCAQDNGLPLGWHIGWIARPQGPLAFAVQLEDPVLDALRGQALRTARGALAELGFWPAPVPGGRDAGR
jgi:beta-lactamase class D